MKRLQKIDRDSIENNCTINHTGVVLNFIIILKNKSQANGQIFRHTNEKQFEGKKQK